MRIRALLLLICLLPAAPVMAAGKPKLLAGASNEPTSKKPELDIEAVVGDQVISSYDLNSRMAFIISTTKLSNTPEVIARIRPQILRTLIDERLQLQEAKRKEIKVDDADIGKAIAAIEKERGMEPGAIFKQLEQAHVPVETFAEQLRAQISWNKLVGKVVRPKVRVSDEEIALSMSKTMAPATKKELQIAVINLPIDKPSRETEIRKLADNLVQEVRKGANFEEVSRQFSASKIESFWVMPENLEPGLAKILAGVQPGAITDPVRSELGYTVVKLYDVRQLSEEQSKDEELSIKEILLKLKSTDHKEADALLSIAESVAKDPGSCEDTGVANIKNLQDIDIAVSKNNTKLSDLAPAIVTIVKDLKIGDISQPYASAEGVRLFMVCDRKEVPLSVKERARVSQAIYQQKLELEAQKYLRALRRDMFIEIR
ncbi:MAG: peptidylprolyl isomerase [Rickettsiales bacterium]|nr:peptidylprolyl isomerase [Rickettsiales bacterium]